MKNFILRTDKMGSFSVANLFSNDQVLISLPHRVSLTISRLGEKIVLYCDLGLTSSDIDFKEVCVIDISNKDYPTAILFNHDFMTIARSFDSSFCVGKFLRARVNPHSGAHAGYFGRSWNDQIYIQLAQPIYKRIANIEFSIFQENRIEFSGEQCELEEPAITLVASLQLYGQPAHYFFFVEWDGNDLWSYRKNFFFNNTLFTKKEGGKNEFSNT